MICLHCAHADLKANPTYSKIGLAKCNVMPYRVDAVAVFMPLLFKNKCPDYVEASQEIITARDNWNTKRIA